MKVAVNAKLRTHVTPPRKPKEPPELAALPTAADWARMLFGRRPMYWRLLPDHSVEPIVGDDFAVTLEWAREFEKDRQLARDEVEGRLISTIFLGLDHSFLSGPPVLFETMAFTDTTKYSPMLQRDIHEELTQRRYSTYDEAMRGHAEVVAEIRAFAAIQKRVTE